MQKKRTTMTVPRNLRRMLFPLIAIAIGFSVPLVLVEIVLRFLPVSTGLSTQPVNEANPVYHFQPDRDFIWSRDWNFNIVNRGHVNNVGFVNDRDYETDKRTPLLTVIGDSYVEAVMVPYPDTLHGRLASMVEGRGRVYSFAASGAPLSQYLVWARHASHLYGADAMVFVIVGNDFDESLLGYKQSLGMHVYEKDVDGTLNLVRTDYEPSALRSISKGSALARYLLINLQGLRTLRRTLRRLRDDWVPKTFGGSDPAEGDHQSGDDEQRFLGNVPRAVEAKRLADAKLAVDAFFRDLPRMVDLPLQRILFVVDGVRYPHLYDSKAYFVTMRRYFLDRATQLGYSTADMDSYFLPEHEANGTRFEFATDAHWNAEGHRLAAEAIASTHLFEQTFFRSTAW